MRRSCRINRSTHIVAGSLIFAVVAGGAVAQDSASKGELAFNYHCRSCHSLKPGDHRQGPSLNGVIGAKAGSTDYAGYSEGMKSAGVTWDEATLDRFVANPDQVIPNNKMKPYTGLTDANVRKQVVDFLGSKKGS